MKKTISNNPCLEMRGFNIASPQCFMAALGLLRVCAQDLGLDVRLSWATNYARLYGVDWPALHSGLVKHMSGRSAAPEFNFSVKVDNRVQIPVRRLNAIRPEDYRSAAISMCDNPRALGFLAAFATDAVVTDKGYVTQTRFDFTTARQTFMGKLLELAKKLEPGSAEFERLLHNAIFGGPYEVSDSFGWDPVTARRHACESEAPTDTAPISQPFCVWLAIESLPLHPVIPFSPGRAMTVGFWGNEYVYPQWNEPLSLDEVRLLRQRAVDTLPELIGVTAVWHSAITSVGRYPILSAAVRRPGYLNKAGRVALGDNLGVC